MRPTRMLLAQRPSITGFDSKKFAAASGSPANDPWARAEAWRYTGPFTRFNRFKKALPGLGTASVAFAVYLAYEHFFLKEEHGHHGADAHHDEKGHH
ncbi:NADH-ubiquinone oxidoreductase B12 subunit family-domain-containing protein [Dendryphion nanum]|uniref:NADH-ubiquinone oxidoreductase B12 subunit family-domain-containing protein n=1 Tax=Dendryphion nanum TaxID=256645 RepID=A0A9P9DD85_9PLEO|nr:NADH-ubiquinone oxidoreductase B12 subunit family-domain-containing protein [Dendryphion nanum]